MSDGKKPTDLQKQLGELGDVIHNKLKEDGKDTSQADNAVEGVKGFINDAYGKVEKSDDKEKTQDDIAQNILGKFEQYAGKGETNKSTEEKKD
ncbi:hypothetical protein CLIB1423_09S04126 [[Candida] railenensis]|uniref:Uncharacterized protein n=1 Tax=[Candida] railenensis TaxID=45579 RepID=A0A9P0QQQ5_9ASCO|nr:hypothetical protein CLIB1423_09S04126 [[Candida] railenensis]